MASYLRPRRGKEATAISQSLVLKRGEIFFEVPATGVGTGSGRIKMGDGSTPYGSLPYFLDSGIVDIDSVTIGFTNSTTPSTTPDSVYLTAISPTTIVKDLFTALKQLLVNYSSKITYLSSYAVTTDNTTQLIGGQKEFTNLILPNVTPSNPVNGNIWIS